MENNERAAAENQYPAWYKHVDYILGENPRRVRGQAVMRRGRLSVWAVIGYYLLYEKDKTKTVHTYRDRLTVEEMDAALAFYADNPEDIDRKLFEIANGGEFIPMCSQYRRAFWK